MKPGILMIAASLLLAAPALAAERLPATSDEARALSGASLPANDHPARPAVGTAPTTTDEARGFGGAQRLASLRSSAPIAAVATPSSTDEARALAGVNLRSARGAQERPVESAASAATVSCR